MQEAFSSCVNLKVSFCGIGAFAGLPPMRNPTLSTPPKKLKEIKLFPPPHHELHSQFVCPLQQDPQWQQQHLYVIMAVSSGMLQESKAVGIVQGFTYICHSIWRLNYRYLVEWRAARGLPCVIGYLQYARKMTFWFNLLFHRTANCSGNLKIPAALVVPIVQDVLESTLGTAKNGRENLDQAVLLG